MLQRFAERTGAGSGRREVGGGGGGGCARKHHHGIRTPVAPLCIVNNVERFCFFLLIMSAIICTFIG